MLHPPDVRDVGVAEHEPMSAPLLPVAGTFAPSAVVARRIRLRDRLAARWRVFELDAQLARGVSPDASVRLVLRAHRLLSPAVRTTLSRGLHRTIRDARVGRTRVSTVAVRRGAVL